MIEIIVWRISRRAKRKYQKPSSATTFTSLMVSCARMCPACSIWNPDSVKHLYFRGDAAFANPEMYEFLDAKRTG
jgi:hypothetical protein